LARAASAGAMLMVIEFIDRGQITLTVINFAVRFQLLVERLIPKRGTVF
jgi:hypothetical protein